MSQEIVVRLQGQAQRKWLGRKFELRDLKFSSRSDMEQDIEEMNRKEDGTFYRVESDIDDVDWYLRYRSDQG